MLSGENYIGFSKSASGQKKFKTFNPILNEQNEAEFTEATDEEINQAANKASKAFHVYSKKTGTEKAVFLNKIADEILALGDELVQTYMSETGLAEARCIGERGRTIFQLRSFAELLEEGSWVEARIDTAVPDRTPIPVLP